MTRKIGREKEGGFVAPDLLIQAFEGHTTRTAFVCIPKILENQYIQIFAAEN